MHAQRGPNATPAAAAGASSGRAAESFVEWASTQRRRAALDGAWKVQVTERLLPDGGCIGSVVTWHDNAGQPSTPVRRGRQQGGDVPGQPEEHRPPAPIAHSDNQLDSDAVLSGVLHITS